MSSLRRSQSTIGEEWSGRTSPFESAALVSSQEFRAHLFGVQEGSLPRVVVDGQEADLSFISRKGPPLCRLSRSSSKTSRREKGKVPRTAAERERFRTPSGSESDPIQDDSDESQVQSGEQTQTFPSSSAPKATFTPTRSSRRIQDKGAGHPPLSESKSSGSGQVLYETESEASNVAAPLQREESHLPRHSDSGRMGITRAGSARGTEKKRPIMSVTAEDGVQENAILKYIRQHAVTEWALPPRKRRSRPTGTKPTTATTTLTRPESTGSCTPPLHGSRQVVSVTSSVVSAQESALTQPLVSDTFAVVRQYSVSSGTNDNKNEYINRSDRRSGGGGERRMGES